MSNKKYEWHPWLTPTYDILKVTLQDGSLGHSHIISGQGDIGQSLMVRKISQLILCLNPENKKACGVCRSCQLFQNNTHPDLHWLQSDGLISVGDMRSSIVSLSNHPSVSSCKIWVIDRIDQLSFDAYQVGLKTFEEPGQNLFIFLIHEQTKQIKPTLRSRFQYWPIQLNYESWSEYVDKPNLFNFEWLRGSLEALTDKQHAAIATCHLLTGRLNEVVMKEFSSQQLLDLWQMQLLVDLRQRIQNNASLTQASLWQYFKVIDLFNDQRRIWSIHAGLSESMALFNLWHQARQILSKTTVQSSDQ